MNKIFLFSLIIYFSTYSIYGQEYQYKELTDEKVYSSLEEALLEPENVFRLKLKRCKKCDSLPEEIFQLTQLQELTVSKLKLKKINSNISQLKNLKYLNISRNKLTSLPETIGNLTELCTLIINRNKITELPSSISNLKKLTLIDAWDNPLYVLPPSIIELAPTLKEIDLRQVPLRDTELEEMERLLPNTKIKYTSICECQDNR